MHNGVNQQNMQNATGGLNGYLQQFQAMPANILIPIKPEDWKKPSRDTQLRILDELGILNA